MTSREVKDLGAKLTGSGATFTTSEMKVSGWGDLTLHFNAGDAITITGCTTQEANNKDIVIKSLTADTITVAADTFTAATEASTEVTLERKSLIWTLFAKRKPPVGCTMTRDHLRLLSGRSYELLRV